MADALAPTDATEAEIKDIDLWLAHLPGGFFRSTLEARRDWLVKEGTMPRDIVLRNFTEDELLRLIGNSNIAAGYLIEDYHVVYARRWQRLAARFGRFGRFLARRGPPPNTIIDRARLLDCAVMKPGQGRARSPANWRDLEVESQAAPEEKR